ncbi:S8 family serine peptidase [Paraburkholderia terricola]|uniref:Subtilisin family serine protease n=1 Tax=Paraburkholderia terricola TaxID=169427 RepID=A0ABU1M046_9BURK|nr:S8 family serine peptidase [Paraburkholderia terricola]MDR6412372.1 subtilisin family serine protease [Paraburkholderia terricola]MDR6481178.1 subtilisin family serine protease [Paraburkholderia terricola]
MLDKAYDLARDVHFTVSTRTVGGKPLHLFNGPEHGSRTDEFLLCPEARDWATRNLQALGFHVHYQGWFEIHVSGTAALVAELLGKKLTLHAGMITPEQSDCSRGAITPVSEELFFAPRDSLYSPARGLEGTDCFFLPPASSYATTPQPSPHPPQPGFHHVGVPDIRRLLQVPNDADGDGITVALVDTGFARHPFYLSNQYDYQPTWAPPPSLPDSDTDGHGTAIALNLFAVAPKVKMLGFVKDPMPQTAIQMAVNSGVDIISCSWGWSLTPDVALIPTLEATIYHTVNSYGKVVLFAAGNGPLKAWPASMPNVIAVGGVHWNATNSYEASNFASGFASDAYPGRAVPDVCGLCGQQPAGVYIMLPCPSGSAMDVSGFAGGQAFPAGDEQQPGDGWAGASGTSSAAPQVAGVVALLLQKARAKGMTLSTSQIKDLLKNTAVPVTMGANAHKLLAQGHPNGAVGYGLVNASAALAAI